MQSMQSTSASHETNRRFPFPPIPTEKKLTRGEEPTALAWRKYSLGFERWAPGCRPWSSGTSFLRISREPTRKPSCCGTNPRRDGTSVGMERGSGSTCRWKSIGTCDTARRWRRCLRRFSPRHWPRRPSCSTTKERKRTCARKTRSRMPKEGASSQDWKPNTQGHPSLTDPIDSNIYHVKVSNTTHP